MKKPYRNKTPEERAKDAKLLSDVKERAILAAREFLEILDGNGGDYLQSQKREFQTRLEMIHPAKVMAQQKKIGCPWDGKGNYNEDVTHREV
jgi:hypothetical protein